jgi:hypothetical protein
MRHPNGPRTRRRGCEACRCRYRHPFRTRPALRTVWRSGQPVATTNREERGTRTRQLTEATDGRLRIAARPRRSPPSETREVLRPTPPTSDDQERLPPRHHAPRSARSPTMERRHGCGLGHPARAGHRPPSKPHPGPGCTWGGQRHRQPRGPMELPHHSTPAGRTRPSLLRRRAAQRRQTLLLAALSQCRHRPRDRRPLQRHPHHAASLGRGPGHLDRARASWHAPAPAPLGPANRRRPVTSHTGPPQHADCATRPRRR